MIKQKLLDNYEIKDMTEWDAIDADLVITDPPFGIKFNGKNTNYCRKTENVVDGYIEWNIDEYSKNTKNLLNCIYKNTKENGQALIFSGWNYSNLIATEIEKSNFNLQGKLYWSYNFAPACKNRPAHNVYEIFWLTKNKKWFYKNRCATNHCQHNEANLSTFKIKRDYVVNMPKYPTRLPFQLLQSLLEHFSDENSLIFDPLAGSGMLGVVSFIMNRKFLLGDKNPNGKIVFNELIKHYNQNKRF